MAQADLVEVDRIGDEIHPAYPEDPGVFAERLQLYPAGCFVLDDPGGPQGYCVSHPWRFGDPPKLNSRLGQLPAEADTFYIHDIGLLPAGRGLGLGAAIVDNLAGVSAMETMSLVAVGDSAPFWQRLGFQTVEDPRLHARLLSYGASARFMVRRLA